jgi:CO dehydrogenase maturation factor
MIPSKPGPPLIALLGKGGTGKTTLAALLLKLFRAKGVKPILAVDADPNSCLPDLIGLSASATVGSIKREILDRREELASSSLSKTEYCEYALENAITESAGFDIVVMGRPDGEGCYCYINSIIHSLIDRLKRSYRLVIADCEAGLEHLSRRTLGNVDTALIVSDLSRKGVETAARQVALMNEVSISTRRVLLVFNNSPDTTVPRELADAVRRSGLSVAGVVRHDTLVSRYELSGRSLLELPENCTAYSDLTEIMDRNPVAMDLPQQTI